MSAVDYLHWPIPWSNVTITPQNGPSGPHMPWPPPSGSPTPQNGPSGPHMPWPPPAGSPTPQNGPIGTHRPWPPRVSPAHYPRFSVRGDAYDPAVAFDDIYGCDEPAAEVDHAQLAQEILGRAHRRRLRAPVTASVFGVDPTRWTFAPIGCEILGADVEPAGPVFNDLHSRFSKASPQPKVVRLDTPSTYAAFRDERREPHLQRFTERLRRVEEALARHVADRSVHVHGLDEEIILGLDEAHDEVTNGGVPIPLPVDNTMCWRDGGEILVTMVLPAPGGPVLATSATPVEQHVDEMMGCVWGTGASPEDVVAVARPVVEVLGATKVMEEICSAQSDLVQCLGAGGRIALLQSASNPALAAAMALVQRAQHGDRRALDEVVTMARSRKHKRLIGEAVDRLLSAQRQKAAKRSRRSW